MKYGLCIASPEIKVPFVFNMMGGTFEEKLSKMKKMGYSGVELLCGDPINCDTEFVLSQCKKNNLSVSDVSSGAVVTATGLHLLAKDKEERLQSFELFKGMVSLAEKLGTKVVTIGAFRGLASDMGGTAFANEYLADVFSRLKNQLSNSGIKVALEQVNRKQTDIFTTFSEISEYLDKLSDTNIGILYDTYNADLEEKDPFDSLESVLKQDRLIHFHIADTDRKVPGFGSIDFSKHLEILRKYSYDGFLSAELDGTSDPDGSCKKIIDNMIKFEQA